MNSSFFTAHPQGYKLGRKHERLPLFSIPLGCNIHPREQSANLQLADFVYHLK